MLTLHGYQKVVHESQGETIQARLRRQMQEDTLEPLDGSETRVVTLETFSPEVVEESVQFLRLQVRRYISIIPSLTRKYSHRIDYNSYYHTYVISTRIASGVESNTRTTKRWKISVLDQTKIPMINTLMSLAHTIVTSSIKVAADRQPFSAFL